MKEVQTLASIASHVMTEVDFVNISRCILTTEKKTLEQPVLPYVPSKVMCNLKHLSLHRISNDQAEKDAIVLKFHLVHPD